MMIDLTHKFYDKIIFNDMEIKLNLAFDNVLYAYNIINDDSIGEYQKIIQSISVLAVLDTSMEFDIYELADILTQIFGYLNNTDINYYYGTNSQKILDFTLDASLIYSAFLQDYCIDLYEQQGKLHWFKFLMLLDNITNKTKLSEVIGYRVIKLPPENKYNREEIRRLRKLKRIYALEQPPDVVNQQMDDYIGNLFSIFGSN